MSYGTTLLKRDDVMEGVPEMVHEVQWKPRFLMGPNSSPSIIRFVRRSHIYKKFEELAMIPGEAITQPEIELNQGRSTVWLR